MTPWRVMVLGARGQLGTTVARTFADHAVTAHARDTLDVTDPIAVRDAVRALRPDVILNCAAFNDVDGAEARVGEAFDANAFAVRSVARAADACGAVLVHYSTDFVFDGETDRPYEERDAPSPQSVYAMSKLVGEWFALESPRAFVLRVESLFGMPRGWSGRRSSLEGIVLALEARAPVKAFTDRVVSPSHVGDVAAATRHLLQTAAEPGLYHCVNSGHGTWFELAREAARVLDAGHVIEPVTMSDMPLRARRPRYCALSNRKLDAAGFAMPSWQDALRRWMAARVAPIE